MGHVRLTRRRAEERREAQRQISAVMDEAPDWRAWFEWQLYLLDLEYDSAHWITFESVRC